MPAAVQGQISPAGRLRGQVMAAAPDQRTGFGGVAQRTEREEKGAICGASPPTRQEQRYRIGCSRHAEHPYRRQTDEQPQGELALTGQLQQQE